MSRWGDTAIRGHAKRGTGILNNALHVGRLVWNKKRYVKDPRMGKRVSKLNPPSNWIVQEVPSLRLIDDALWQRVKARQKAIAREATRPDTVNALNAAHRRQFLQVAA